jgi:tRNA (guanine37-N1)-methyltransferase
MHFDVFTLFPEVFDPYLNAGVLGRARRRGLVDVHLYNIRDWATGRHKTTDDMAYGGGGGMIMKPEPVFAAVEAVVGRPPSVPVILLSAQGRRLDQRLANELVRQPQLALLCGRYEGVDERIVQHLVSEEVCIGDYVLSGGELAALVLIDVLSRLIPGVLGSETAAAEDSFAQGLLEYPQYTRPAVFRGWEVPEVLISGDHEKVNAWRRRQALLRTLERRPDLLAGSSLSEEERRMLDAMNVRPEKEEDTR